MNLVDALAAGVRGAENGYARLFVRGTTTRASWYEDFEGTAVDSSGDNVDLDGDGRAIVYVNQYVTVEVYTSGGVQVTEFTVGTSTPDVEYQGAAFTGTNYSSAATGAGSGYAVTLHTILARALTSFGSTDWNVLVNGAATSLQVAIGGMSGIFYNVKSPAYGAVGDGVTDDTTAIQAAIDAAETAGGGIVFLPEGSYLVTSGLTLPSEVSLWGSGGEASVVGYSATTGSALTVESGGSGFPPRSIRGIVFRSAQTNTDGCVFVENGAYAHFAECTIQQLGTQGSCLQLEASSSTRVIVDSCVFLVLTTSSGSMITSASNARVEARNAVFTGPATYNPSTAVVYGNYLTLTDCLFDFSLTTSGTASLVRFNVTTLRGSVSGCTFLAGGGSTLTAMVLGTYAADSMFAEQGNTFDGSGLTAYSYVFAAAATGSKVMLRTRETRHIEYASDASPLSIATTQYGSITVRRSSNAAQTLTPDAAPPEGATGTVFVFTSGTPGDITLGSPFAGIVVAAAVATGLALNDDISVGYRSMLARGGNVRCQMIGVWEYTH